MPYTRPMHTAPRVALHGRLESIPGGNAGAFATVSAMRGMVRRFRADPAIRKTAMTVVFMTPERDQLAEVDALFSFVRDHIRYTRDVLNVETLATPDKTLALRSGDCDDQSTLLAALLESLGYKTRFVIAGYNGSKYFAHVYVQVQTREGWINLDPTEDHGVGWAPANPSKLWIERV